MGFSDNRILASPTSAAATDYKAKAIFDVIESQLAEVGVCSVSEIL